jgi:hypothetical protein
MNHAAFIHPNRSHPSSISIRPVAIGLLVAGLLCGASLRADTYSPPTNGLVGWWSGNGNATDSSGNGHNGTIQGEGFTPGLYGLAFASDSNKRVFVSDSAGFQITGSLTIAAWVNMSSPSYIILQRGDNRPGLDPFTLGGDGAGRMGIQIDDASDNGIYLSAPMALNQWVQVTGTLDGSTGDLRVYLNGVLSAETTTTIRPFANLDPSQIPGIGIGNNPSSSNFPFVGTIDEVLLYNRALSPTEVAGLVPEPGTLSIALGAGLFLVGKCLKRGMRSAECGTAVLKG